MKLYLQLAKKDFSQDGRGLGSFGELPAVEQLIELRETLHLLCYALL